MSARVSIELEVAYPPDTRFMTYPQISGVYIIQNVFSDRCYVGATQDVAVRWRGHYLALTQNWHINKFLLAEFTSDPDLFVFRLIEKCPVSDLRDREVYHATAHEAHSQEWGYNPQSHRYPNRQHPAYGYISR